MGLFQLFFGKPTHKLQVLNKGIADRVVFFYPGEEGTYIDQAHVTLYENGIVHIETNQENTTTTLNNCEILWEMVETEDEEDSRRKVIKLVDNK